MSHCTGTDCENETSTYLCTPCTTELHGFISLIPDLVPILKLITTREEQPFTNRTPPTSIITGGPSTPLNLSADALAQTLTEALTLTANEYAQQSDAGNHKTYIEHQVTQADIMVNGEPEIQHTPAYLAYRMKQVLPMPSKHLIPWFAETFKIRLTDTKIRKWAERGIIIRANAPGQHPTYHPAEILKAHSLKNRPESVQN
ncbi:hypothetical protein [Glutamicibacter arilaitensis]|uniref:hypothetical protein n=1 Tax=Glutamicibacter arilaitensis TaxID=256701 RepID=UPI00384C0BD5